MSTATTTETALADGLGAKLRKTVIGAGFAVVLLVPKVLSLRRDERSWVIFRMVLGVFGAALVVLPIGFLWQLFSGACRARQHLLWPFCCPLPKPRQGPTTRPASWGL